MRRASFVRSQSGAMPDRWTSSRLLDFPASPASGNPWSSRKLGCEFAREREWVCGYIGLNPLLECAAHYPPGDVYQQNDFFLDLWLGETELYRRLSKGRKHQIKNMERSWELALH